MSRPYLVGLTGGMASGKSTVASLLRERGGFTVIDADDLVAELHRPGKPGAAAVRALFGAEALDERGAVDREAVAARIFADPAARGRLEAALHPLVRRRFAELARESANGNGVAVLEATLLVEAGYTEDFDLVINVEADPEVRLARAVARGMSEAAARARLEAQGDGAARRAAAHRTIRNDGTPAELRASVDELIDELRERARAAAHRPASEETAER